MKSQQRIAPRRKATPLFVDFPETPHGGWSVVDLRPVLVAPEIIENIRSLSGSRTIPRSSRRTSR